MKKILIFAIMFFMLVGVFGVAAADQTVVVNVTPVVDISVNNIDYGNVIPGATSDKDSVITAGINNNVDLTVQISVTSASTNNLFRHIIFDLENNGFGDNSQIGTGTLLKDILLGTSSVTIPTRLAVPTGFVPGTYNGVVSYVAMQKIAV